MSQSLFFMKCESKDQQEEDSQSQGICLWEVPKDAFSTPWGLIPLPTCWCLCCKGAEWCKEEKEREYRRTGRQELLQNANRQGNPPPLGLVKRLHLTYKRKRTKLKNSYIYVYVCVYIYIYANIYTHTCIICRYMCTSC